MENDYIDIHTHNFTRRYPELHAAGIHPWRAEESNLQTELEHIADSQPEAIGETGLDYACTTDRSAQQRLFRLHLDVAQRLGLPIVLHCVRAFEPVMDILSEYNLRAVIFHGFIGSKQQAARAVAAGYSLSFGIMTPRSPKTIEALRFTPIQNIFAETDESGVAIEEVYAMIADIKQIDIDTLKCRIAENYNRLFNHDHV